MHGTYKKWVDEDVHWIITDQELKAFKSLSNDEERDQFIEQFWLRRNPNPDSPENEFREEHYRRIAYANEHFAAGKPGWKTDRGHIYIAFGKPDSIDSHPSGGSYERPMEEGGGKTSTFPFEIWHYRYLEGVGDNIDIEFVDTCMCGDYHMTIDRSEKDALLHVPGAGPDALRSRWAWPSRRTASVAGLEQPGQRPDVEQNQSKQFDRLEQFAKLHGAAAGQVQGPGIVLVEPQALTGPSFLFDVRTDFVKVTDDTVLVPVTLQIKNRDITFNTKDGVSKGVVNILGRVSTITEQDRADLRRDGGGGRASGVAAARPGQLPGLLEGACRYVRDVTASTSRSRTSTIPTMLAYGRRASKFRSMTTTGCRPRR